MKLSALALTASVLVFSSLANAKVSYIEGTVNKIDSNSKLISIIENESGAVKTFRYDETANNASGFKSPKKIAKLSVGQEVTLKLKATKAK